MQGLRHELISASAGSGKTWQLVRRYLHLLALGEPAPAIVAMTFTRKAAGEFFNRILARLARLATGHDDPAAYFAGLEPPAPPNADYARLLRQLTRALQRLRLGTLDSFFTTVVACFPLETGLPAAATVMDEEEEQTARMETLDALLDRTQQQGDDEAARTLLQAIKQARFGSEKKNVEELLRGWVAEIHPLWMDSADAGVWGEPARLWPDADWREEVDGAALQAAARALRGSFPAVNASGEQWLEELEEQVARVTPAADPPRRVKTFLEKTGEHLDALLAGSAAMAWNRNKIEISGETARAWLRLAGLLCRREFLARAHRTRALADFLRAYEQCYHERVRSRGLLAFADVPRLLNGEAEERGGSWPGEDLWFRLDGRFHHWMLDEFQDTSHSQWRVTSRLVSEVLQDDSGRRSFFAVGDIKQSIYLWRQAEPGIFMDLAGAPGIHQGSLAKSYRSVPEVLEAVNRVFGDRAAIETDLPGAAAHWIFEPHSTGLAAGGGCAALLQAVKNEDDEEGESAADAVARAVAALLRRIDPLRRGLTCAVLVRGNRKALELSDELRALTGLSVVTESKSQPATDNAPALALLCLLQLAAHPHDNAALGLLRMSPLRPLVENETRGAALTALEIARTVFERGFAAFAIEWSGRLREVAPDLDAFNQARLAQFADFCAAFDETGSRDIDRFLEAARRHTAARPPGLDAVQVMTVHKAKGLEFDVVILAELGGLAMDTRRQADWLVSRDDEGRTRWVLQRPLKVYAEADPVLREHARRARASAGFESLCLLYVAMTRARRALYLVTEPAPKKSESVKMDEFLRRRLGAAAVEEWKIEDARLRLHWQHGDLEWFAALPERASVAAPPAAAPAPPLRDLVRANQPSQRRRTPSGEEAFRVRGSVLFSPGRDFGRHLGSRVHELLAEVEWWSAAGGDEAALRAHWRERGLLAETDAVTEPALKLVLPVLRDPALAAVLARPSGPALVWREKPFDFIDDDGWISGVFDRVVLTLDADGRPAGAAVYDFKTDEAPDAAALEEKRLGYAPQLALYRRAVARLTGLPEAKVACHLVFLRAGRLVAV